MDHGARRNLHRRELKISTEKRETTAHRLCKSEPNERLGAGMTVIHELLHERYSYKLVKGLQFSIKENAASESCCAQTTSSESKLGSIDIRYPIPHIQQLTLNQLGLHMGKTSDTTQDD